MPQTKTRIVGSGFTSINWRGQPIAFLEGFQDAGQKPMADGGPGYQAIYPIGFLRAAEIATSRVLSVGTASFDIREEWSGPVWQAFPGLRTANTITDVFRIISEDPTETTFQMIIKPPGGRQWRGRTYHNVVIYDIPDGETVGTATMTQTKTISAAYTHRTPFTLAAS